MNQSLLWGLIGGGAVALLLVVGLTLWATGVFSGEESNVPVASNSPSPSPTSPRATNPDLGKGTPGRTPEGTPVSEPPPVDQIASTDLKLFGIGYSLYRQNRSAPPRSIADLETVVASDRPIDFDRYNIIWGVEFSAMRQARTVLAYEKTVPQKGGMVLFADGSVESVTAEAFQNLPKAQAVRPLSERKGDVTFTPTEYYVEFKKLGIGMGSRYQQKLIELKGVVKGYSRTSGNIELLVISPGNEQESVRCFLSDGEPWAKYSLGQQVTVKGFVRLPQGNPMLTRCEVTTTGPNLAVTTTAEQMAKDIAADSDMALAKYQNKSLLLTGEVLSVEKGSRLSVKLKGTADQPIGFSLNSRYVTKEQEKQLVPGATIRLYGEYLFGFQLKKCELLSK